jgi:hypothetical protein
VQWSFGIRKGLAGGSVQFDGAVGDQHMRINMSEPDIVYDD